ncbi:MAG: metallophosphoesterase [Gaiellaceae bacterium]|nr:MAG: metallophosphoesterase [Gaiellaceae bacterium]
MRIVYVVDVHDRFDRVVEVVRPLGAVDALVVGGDLTNAGSPEDAERALELWRPLAPTLVAVAGNMDSPAIDRRLAELGVSLDGRGVVLDDVGLHGVSASGPTPLSTPYELPDDELGRRAQAGHADVAGCRIRIFCPHSPPRGTACDRLASGAHVGSPSLRAFVEREQPDLVLCGHIHESRGEDVIGRTKVVNPGPVASGHCALVEVDGGVSVTLR